MKPDTLETFERLVRLLNETSDPDTILLIRKLIEWYQNEIY